jgi:hypothetical protein
MGVDETFASAGRFYKGNLHTHSNRSDGVRDPEAVCATYRDAGYDFLALTDHFLDKFDFPIVDTRPYRSKGFTTIIGAELHAPQISVGEMWHILAVGLPLDFARTPPSESGPELAERAAASGAYVAIPHPSWYALTLEDADSITVAHAVEVYNHTSEVKLSNGDSSAMIDVMLSKGRRITLCATDDAHFRMNDWFGGYVMVKATSAEPEALVSALKAGHYYSSQGPEIYGITTAGDTLEIECSPARAVIALGSGSASAVAHGRDLKRVTLPLDRLKTGGFARIVVIDERGRKAWSNPIWF